MDFHFKWISKSQAEINSCCCLLAWKTSTNHETDNVSIYNGLIWLKPHQSELALKWSRRCRQYSHIVCKHFSTDRPPSRYTPRSTWPEASTAPPCHLQRGVSAAHLYKGSQPAPGLLSSVLTFCLLPSTTAPCSMACGTEPSPWPAQPAPALPLGSLGLDTASAFPMCAAAWSLHLHPHTQGGRGMRSNTDLASITISMQEATVYKPQRKSRKKLKFFKD